MSGSFLQQGSYLSENYLGESTLITDLTPQHSGGNIVGSVPAVFPNDQSIGSPVGEDIYLPGGIVIKRQTLITIAVVAAAALAVWLVVRKRDG